MPFIFISFIAGVLTVLAPCILPLLPVIVGRSIADTTLSKRRLFTVIISLGLSIILFTLVLKVSTLFINIPENFWKYFSGGIILFFGIVTIYPSLWDRIPLINSINRKSNEALAKGYKKNNIWGDAIVGASLGPIFSACSPTYFVILATVLPASFALGMLYLFVFTIGLCGALLVLSFLGQKVVAKLGVATDSGSVFKKIIGILFILVALMILTGYDKKFQTSLLEAGFLDVTKIEQNILDKKDTEDKVEKEKVKENLIQINGDGFLTIEQKSKKYPKAPDISTPDYFINTGGDKINISQYKGKKVVLLDIWTYSCINCKRTLPYLNEWYKKYEDEGLVIIGLHTPEFSFEKVKENVEGAVKKENIKYPIVMDNDFSTWRAYENRYWPMKYIIDMDGYVVYAHAGEGAYDETELKIQELLSELHTKLDMKSDVSGGIIDPTNKIVVGDVGSPEIYFGSDRNQYLANGNIGQVGIQDLIIPNKIELNKLYLGGSWFFEPEFAQSSAKISEVENLIVYKYNAKNVYMVANAPIDSMVEVYVDDVFLKKINISDDSLYHLVEGNNYGVHTLKLLIHSPINVFTFTFG